MKERFRSGSSRVAAALAAGAMIATPLPAGSQGTSMKAPPASIANVVKFGPDLKSADILARPDTAFVELPDGRRLKVGDIRRLSGQAQRLQVAAVRRAPPALVAKPGPAGARVGDAAELAAALKRPGGETVTLPSGRRATVAQLRFVQPYVEKRTGRSMAVANPQRANLSGPAVKVTAQSDFKDLLQRPDTTVLEAPDGTRITVGELKKVLAQGGAAATGR